MSFWQDEIASVEISKLPLRQLWSDWMLRETNPPLYYSALHLWRDLFGDSEFAVRVLSVLAGVCAVPLMYVLGRDLHSRRAGLIAALFTALWSHQIYFSQEARSYVFGMAAAMIATIGLVRISDQLRADGEGRGDATPWLLYLGGALGAVYTHTTHVLLPLLANLYFAWFWLARTPRRGRPLAWWAAVNLVLAIAWSWWGWITLRQLLDQAGNIAWIPQPSLADAANIVTMTYGPTGVTLENSFLRIVLQIGGASVILAGAVFGVTRLKLERAVLLALLAVGTPLILYLVSLHTPVLLHRTLIWAQFAVIAALAVATASLPERTGRYAAVVALAALLCVGRTVRDPKEPWRELVAELDRSVGPGEVVLVTGLGVYLRHYCEKLRCDFEVADVVGVAEEDNRWKMGLPHPPRLHPADLPDLVASRARIWTVSHGFHDPRPLLHPYAEPAPTAFAAALPDPMKVTVWRRRGPSRE